MKNKFRTTEDVLVKDKMEANILKSQFKNGGTYKGWSVSKTELLDMDKRKIK